MQKIVKLCVAAACAASPAGSLAAQETDTPTLLAYLGLSAADGKTTVGDNAAAVEATMLVSALAVATADRIKTKIKESIATPQTDYTIVLLAKDEKFSLLPYRQAMGIIGPLEKQRDILLNELKLRPCQSKPPKRSPTKSLAENGEPLVEEPRSFDLKASDIIGALKTSTTLTAAPVDPGVELLKAALSTSDHTLNWSSPGDIMDAPTTQALIDRVAAIQEAVKPSAGKNCPGNEDAAKVSDAILTAAGSLTAAKDGAPSLLDRAAAVAALAQTPEVKVLRVEVAKAGGTLINTANIWTSLGVPALSMRGGMVTTYRLINPGTGRTQSAGIVTCRYANQLLIRINKRVPLPKDADCDVIASTTAPKPADVEDSAQ